MKVWRFCAGWNPERALIAAALYDTRDLEALFDHLLVIDAAIKAHQEAQRRAEDMRKGVNSA